MLIQIAPRVKVFVTEEDMNFLRSHSKDAFRSSQLSIPEQNIAKRLADKSIFVRKKINDGIQYQLNRHIKKIF